jgi:hypothetical protein
VSLAVLSAISGVSTELPGIVRIQLAVARFLKHISFFFNRVGMFTAPLLGRPGGVLPNLSPLRFFSRIRYHFQQVCELVKFIENSLYIQI